MLHRWEDVRTDENNAVGLVLQTLLPVDVEGIEMYFLRYPNVSQDFQNIFNSNSHTSRILPSVQEAGSMQLRYPFLSLVFAFTPDLGEIWIRGVPDLIIIFFYRRRKGFPGNSKNRQAECQMTNSSSKRPGAVWFQWHTKNTQLPSSDHLDKVRT